MLLWFGCVFIVLLNVVSSFILHSPSFVQQCLNNMLCVFVCVYLLHLCDDDKKKTDWTQSCFSQYYMIVFTCTSENWEIKYCHCSVVLSAATQFTVWLSCVLVFSSRIVTHTNEILFGFHSHLYGNDDNNNYRKKE